VFEAESVPAAGRAILRHAIANGTLLASAVRLRMTGELKLGSWYPFRAEQVIVAGHGMVWAAKVRMFGLPVRGSDRVHSGVGSMNWKLLGLFRIAHGEGPDVTRSGTGRLLGEMAAWLPSSLVAAQWPKADMARVGAFGEWTTLTYTLGEAGAIRRISFPRWGNPGGGPWGYHEFRVDVEAERAFGGFTIPSRVRAGWGEDEFFRATVEAAEFR